MILNILISFPYSIVKKEQLVSTRNFRSEIKVVSFSPDKSRAQIVFRGQTRHIVRDRETGLYRDDAGHEFRLDQLQAPPRPVR